jgi:Tfp pilus assembly protein PilF
MRLLHRINSLLLSFFLCALSVQAQRGPDVFGVAPATVVVRVRSLGAPLSVGAIVRITSDMNSVNITEATRDAGQVTIRVVPGRYRVEVRALGYDTATEEIDVFMAGATSTFIIELRPESAPGSTPAPSANPLVLAPKARKELDKAVAAIRDKDFKAAEESLLKVMKMAPGHPDAYYLMAMLRLQTNNRGAALENLKKALQLHPDHVPSLLSLSTMQYEEKNYENAIANLERAIKLNPDSWKAHEVMAASYLAERKFELARIHAARAMELAKDSAPHLQIFLAMAYRGLGQKEKARAEFKQFLATNGNHPMANQAQELLKTLDSPPPMPATANSSSAPAAEKEIAKADATSSAVPIKNDVLPPPAKWPLTPVDALSPKFKEGATCSLPEVVKNAGKHAVNLAKNMEKITATETIQSVELLPSGDRHYSPPWRNYYVVSITEPRSGNLAVEESRQQVSSSGSPLTNVEIRGLFALAAVFHPYYVKDFEMRCEGLTEWRGQPAWSVYFKQKVGTPSRVRTYYTRDRRFDIPLKGRAFVSASDFEIVKMETNLIAPIKDLKLDHEQLSIEYEPVEFASRNLKLWLPATAEYLSFWRGKLYHTRHTMNDYLLFNVDVGEKIRAPKQPQNPPSEKPPLFN